MGKIAMDPDPDPDPALDVDDLDSVLNPFTPSDLAALTSPTISLSSSLRALRQHRLSLRNRLHSIALDAAFAREVAELYGLPLVANRRCGSWYVSPPGGPAPGQAGKGEGKDVYFKSTDGHMGSWGFSLRRLNLGLLDVVGASKGGGCIIVDSTRRGKRMPDALSKTIPIWCAIMNRLLFPSSPSSHTLFTLPNVVSATEHSQISSLLDDLTLKAKSLDLPLDHLRAKISHPLRPIWITPASSPLPPTLPRVPDTHPLVLCTVSRFTQAEEPAQTLDSHGRSWMYIQGAGDDAEGWSRGLTPELFWGNRDALLAAETDEDAEALVERLVAGASNGARAIGFEDVKLIRPTACLFISYIDCGSVELMDAVIDCTEAEAAMRPANVAEARHLHLRVQKGKFGRRNLRNDLERVPVFVADLFSSWQDSTSPRLLVRCDADGGAYDFAAAVALTLLCIFFDANGGIVSRRDVPEQDIPVMTKDFIRSRLVWIVSSAPGANPSRASLNSVNDFLMGSPASVLWRSTTSLDRQRS